MFVDYEMRTGVESWAHVLATLRDARSVLILLSPSFEESPWCLEEAHAAAEQLNTVLPVFFDREASWDEGKLDDAFRTFSAGWDFHQFRAETPVMLEADMISRWRKALDSVASTSYLDNSQFRCVVAHKQLSIQCIRHV